MTLPERVEVDPRAERIIKEHEALRLSAYLCPAGKPTIGWGHTHNVELGQTCTAEEAQAYFEQDYAAAQSTVAHLITARLTPSMLGALTSFAYNVGWSRFEGSTLRRVLNAGDYQAVARELRRWDKGRHPVTGQLVVLGGLKKRRHAEIQLFYADGPA